MELWIVEYFRHCSEEEDGYKGAKWERYITFAGKAQATYWAHRVLNHVRKPNMIMTRRHWIDPNSSFPHVRIRKIKLLGTEWKIVDQEYVNPNNFGISLNFEWIKEGF